MNHREIERLEQEARYTMYMKDRWKEHLSTSEAEIFEELVAIVNLTLSEAKAIEEIRNDMNSLLRKRNGLRGSLQSTLMSMDQNSPEFEASRRSLLAQYSSLEDISRIVDSQLSLADSTIFDFSSCRQEIDDQQVAVRQINEVGRFFEAGSLDEFFASGQSILAKKEILYSLYDQLCIKLSDLETDIRDETPEHW